MNAFWLMLGALAVLSIGYRYYSAFLAAKVMVLDGTRTTPAYAQNDGQNYHPTHKWVLFGHHFAAISGAGPLIGPVLALQFGYLPGYLWLLFGVVLGGAVHDFIILAASVRRGGRSLAEIARAELSPLSALVTSVAILFILVVALAGLALSDVNALHESAWGTFTIAMSIPLAVGLGFYLYKLRPGDVVGASAVGAMGMILCVFLGEPVARSALAPWFTLSCSRPTVSWPACSRCGCSCAHATT